MPLFKFENFIFDSSCHTLTQQGRKVPMRPKAVKLLDVLIQNRHRTLSKSEIMHLVWGCDFARDHLLFQLISEIRKHPLKSEFVRTQPNEGYQWNVSTKVVNKTQLFTPQLAACAAAVILGVGLISFNLINNANKANSAFAVSEHLPAYSALSKGIVALENNDIKQGIQWFEFALKENPESVEISLFLAEALYQEHRHFESAEYLYNILTKENISAYNHATATNLLSLISEQQGKFDAALHYAQQSGSKMLVGNQCSAQFVQQRIDELKSRIGSVIHSGADIAKTGANKNAADSDRKDDSTLLAKNYVNTCNDLKIKPHTTSMCLPASLNGNEYVAVTRNQTFKFS